jgi:uncharacterized protein (DUF1015 family)
MPLIRPFAGLRPVAAHAAEVAAPPYDVVTVAEARQRASGRPWSFLHVSRPEMDFPDGTDPYQPGVYERGAANLRRMLGAGVLRRDARPYYYVYRLAFGGHYQTGLVAAASVDAYESGRIRRHELTRLEKEDDRVRHIEALNAQTGPVLLAYRGHEEIDRVMDEATREAPEYDFSASDGVTHSLWVIRDDSRIARLTELFEALERLYIADGHHRSAAAARVSARRRQSHPEARGPQSHDFFLTVSFSHREMRILPYHRVARDLNGLSSSEFLGRLGRSFAVVEQPQAPELAHRGEFGIYLAGRWYRLRIRPELIPPTDPVARLDVSLLGRYLIEPVLGIFDPRRDRRIDFVGGIRGTGALAERVDSGEMAVAFAVRATGMDELMAVADAEELMPPKSTWFEPKLADGLVSYVLD